MNYLFALFLIVWVAGEVIPRAVLRFRGIKLSFLEYGSSVIKKNIIAFKHNNKVFDALKIIQTNKLDMTIRDIEEMFNANMDFTQVVHASLLAKNRNVKVSNADLRELAYFRKDLRMIVMSKNPGEQVLLADIVSSKYRG